MANGGTAADDQQSASEPQQKLARWDDPDQCFGASFSIPKALTLTDPLATLNPFPRDARITFQADVHVYHVDGSKVPRSVTKLVSSLHPSFIPEIVVQKMKRGRNWAKKRKDYLNPDGTEMTDAQIMQVWDANRTVGANRGTLAHYHFERGTLGEDPEPPWSPEYLLFKEFVKHYLIPSGLLPFRTEVNLFHCGLRLAGQADLLCRDIDGESLVIVDWKRSKEISFGNRYATMHAPLEHWSDLHEVRPTELFSLDSLLGFTSLLWCFLLGLQLLPLLASAQLVPLHP